MALKFTNPWWVVVGAVTGLFVCNGPVLSFTFGVFLKPIMADMGWTRGTTSFAMALGGVVSALTVPLLGWMMGLGWLYWLGVAVVAGLLVYEHSLVSPGDLSRLDVAFFNVNGYIAVILFLSVIAGRLA